MSINRDMKSYELWRKVKAPAPSGADREKWELQNTINVAVYKVDERMVQGNVRYNDVTHTGLTYFKEMKTGMYQLRRCDQTMEVKGFNTDGRLAVMQLKEVDKNV